MIGILIAVLLAAVAYLILVAITGSSIVGIVAAILNPAGRDPEPGFGLGGRFGGGRRGAY
jgi:hypothetical protein